VDGSTAIDYGVQEADRTVRRGNIMTDFDEDDNPFAEDEDSDVDYDDGDTERAAGVSLEEASKNVYGPNWWMFSPIYPLSPVDFWDVFATSDNDVPYGMGNACILDMLICSDPSRGFVFPRFKHPQTGYAVLPSDDIVPLLRKLLHFYENVTPDDIDSYDNRGWYRAISEKFSEQWIKFPSTNTDHKGYVYILKTEDGLYKIGKTIDLDKRVRTLKIQLPYKVELFHSVQTYHFHDFERFLHTTLGYFRMNGEWFKIPESIAQFLKYATKLI